MRKDDYGNGTAVGKRLGVAPTLARRVPAAGRNGKRLTTGEQHNVRAIVGKGSIRNPRNARIGAAALGVGAVGYAASPHGKKMVRQGALGGQLYRHSPEFRNMDRSTRRSFIRDFDSAAQRIKQEKASIGKGARADKIRAVLRGRKSTHQHPNGQTAEITTPSRLGRALGQKKTAGWGHTTTYGDLPPQRQPGSGVTYIGPGRFKDVVGKALPGTNGMGTLVSAHRGKSAAGLVAQSQSTASMAGRSTLSAGGVKAFGGTKPSTAGLSGTGPQASGGGGSTVGGTAGGVGKGVGSAARLFGGGFKSGFKGSKFNVGRGEISRLSSPANRTARRGMRIGQHVGDNAGGYAIGGAVTAAAVGTPGVASGVKSWKRDDVGKRYYDPEDERRHRQGALAAAAGIGGAELGRRGVLDVQRDTRTAREAKRVPGAAVATLRPSKYPPAGPTGAVSRKIKAPAAEQRLAEAMAHDVKYQRWQQQNEAWKELSRAPGGSLKGAVVTRRSAGKLGGGLALLGAGASLHRARREPRRD